MVVCAYFATIDHYVFVVEKDRCAQEKLPAPSLYVHPRHVKRQILSGYKFNGKSKDRKKDERVAFEQVINTEINSSFERS
jgi:hypothetical protein